MRLNNRPIQRLIHSLILMAAIAVPAFCTTVVRTSGTGPFFTGGDASSWVAQSWTQADSFIDVVIKATVFQLAVGPPHGDGFAVLSKKVGNHADQIDATTFSFPASSSQANPVRITLFNNLSLGSGTYYFSIYGDGWWTADPIEEPPIITTDPGVSNVTDELFSTDGGHTFQDTNNGFYSEYHVTGTKVVTNDSPEPATNLMLGGAMLAVALLRRKS